MTSVADVAEYILETEGSMTAMKLQKLVFYAKAWHLVWDESPLFPEGFEAWANGPVCPVLYAKHRRKFKVDRGDIGGNPGNLSDEEKESVDAVVDFYRRYTAAQLSELTHSEDPWKDAREGVQPGDRSTAPITDAALHEFYSGLSRI